MQYFFHLKTRPFEAIKNGTKKVEGRAPKSVADTRYSLIHPGDSIIFEQEGTHESLTTKVLYVKHYADVRTMLETEGVENVLSSNGTIEEGIRSYYAIPNYKDWIEKFGIYAIGIKKME